MGAQARSKLTRRAERAVRAELERSGVADRVRVAYLGLKREDVQADIRAIAGGPAPWSECVPLDRAAVTALERVGYDLAGVAVTAKMLPGRFGVVDGELRQEPPRLELMADASDEAVAAAELAVGRHVPRRAAAAALHN